MGFFGRATRRWGWQGETAILSLVSHERRGGALRGRAFCFRKRLFRAVPLFMSFGRNGVQSPHRNNHGLFQLFFTVYVPLHTGFIPAKTVRICWGFGIILTLVKTEEVYAKLIGNHQRTNFIKTLILQFNAMGFFPLCLHVT